MKIYIVSHSENPIVEIFSSLVEAEECILLYSYYDALYEFNRYTCWDVETFDYKDWLDTMLAMSNEYWIQEWEV